MPQLRDVASDQQTNGTMLSLVIDRDQAARFGIQPSLIDATLYDAFGQRQVTQYLHAAQQLSRDPGDHARSCRAIPNTLNKIYIKSPDHRTNRCRCRRSCTSTRITSAICR